MVRPSKGSSPVVCVLVRVASSGDTRFKVARSNSGAHSVLSVSCSALTDSTQASGESVLPPVRGRLQAARFRVPDGIVRRAAFPRC